MASWVWILSLAFRVLATASAKGPEAASAVDEQEDRLRGMPLVITTWAFVEAARSAWEVVDVGGSSLDAVVAGCSTCERLRCDLSVGYGGSPDEVGETTLDAMIMDGSVYYYTNSHVAAPLILGSVGQTTMDVGAVGALRSVKDAIKAARLVLDHTDHTLLVGDQASAFALSLGISGPANLSTQDSLQMWSTWRDLKCQPNFRKDLIPDPVTSCGPYHLSYDDIRQADHVCQLESCKDGDVGPGGYNRPSALKGFELHNHDTISMAVIDKRGKIAVGTSTNGASYKIPGRVGDGPIAGASAYADDDVGACGATGDGDVMMRFVPCYQVVESMRQGKSPKIAAKDAIKRIKRKYPEFVGAVFAVNRHGSHAGACNGWTFKYAVRGNDMDDVQIYTVSPDTD